MSRPTEDGYYWLRLEGTITAVVVLVHSGRVFFSASEGNSLIAENLIGKWQKVKPPVEEDWG